MMRGARWWGVAMAIGMSVLAGVSFAQAKLELSKTEVRPGERIAVTFAAPASFSENAWVGIIPSAVAHGSEATNDANDVSYQYLKKRRAGTLTFTAPQQPGKYDFRMHDTDNNGVEVASVTFAVGVGAKVAANAPTLNIGKTTFAPGQPIAVSFTAPAGYSQNAWVGIIPSAVAHGSERINDEHDLTYQYLGGKTSGTLTFTAPAPGRYDLRMNDSDSNGKEVASVSFEVR